MDLLTLNLNDNYLHKINIDPILLNFYNLLCNSKRYVKKKTKTKCFTYKIKQINNISDIPKSSMNSSQFFPNQIQSYINNNSLYNIYFNCIIKGRNITVNFIVFHEILSSDLFIINKQIQMIYMWIYILDHFSFKQCSKEINLYVYFTPFVKELPNNRLITINSEHVNTGFTTGCKESTEIVLYRKEEWFKVFIHETFHNFGLDFSDMNLQNINKKIKSVFNVNIEYNLYESYCETWARILNTMFYSFLSLSNKIEDKPMYFASKFYKNMKIEAYHSLLQMLKILNFHDLNYKIITNKNPQHITTCNHLYSEETSVFSYYIITGLLINNFPEFISWCNNNNNTILSFKKTPSNLDKYIDLIKNSTNITGLKKNINIMEDNIILGRNGIIDQSLKMTHINMDKVFAN